MTSIDPRYIDELAENILRNVSHALQQLETKDENREYIDYMRKTMLIIDLSSAVIHSTIELFRADSKREISLDIMRHVTLSTLLKYTTMFHDKRPILAVDGKEYWRQHAFKPYKSHRNKDRKDSVFNWDLFHEYFNEIKQELKQYFPYIIVNQRFCEADDVIAVLCKEFYSDKNKIQIVSSDKDMLQLQYLSNNIFQYSPNAKKALTLKNTDYKLSTHIIKGDKDDGVPNIYTDEIVKGTRQKAVTKKFLQQCNDDGVPDELKKRYKRNKLLIDFEMIPQQIIQKILSSYDQQVENPNKSKVYKYLVEHKMKLLMDRLQDF